MSKQNARHRYAQGRHDPITVLVRFVLTALALAFGLFFVATIVVGVILSLFS